MAGNADSLIRFLLPGLRVRGELSRADGIIAAAEKLHGLHGSPLLLFGQTLIGAILLLSISKGGVRQVLQLDAANDQPSPIRRILAEARAGAVRGYINWHENASMRAGSEHNDRLDAWMQMPVTLSTVRDLGFGQPYISTIRHASPYIADQLVHYLNQSVQIDADILLYGHGGMMIEAMPGCDDERWFRAVAAMAEIQAQQLDHASAESILAPFEALGCNIVGRDEYRYHCGCSAEALQAALQAMPPAELQDLRGDDGCIRISCQYCNRSYSLKA